MGRAAFDSESAQRLAAAGEPVILMRPDTSTADVAGFAVAAGIVTSVGARTAHAALVARQMAKPCVVGCSSMTVDAAADRAQLASTTISGSDWITIDGDRGTIYLGWRETVVTRPEAELAEVAIWRSQLLDRQRGMHKQHPRTEESLLIVNQVRERGARIASAAKILKSSCKGLHGSR